MNKQTSISYKRKQAKRRYIFIKVLKTMLILSILVLACVLGCKAINAYDQKSLKEYNNGICPKCHEGYKTSTYYEKNEGQYYIHFECPHHYEYRGAVPERLVDNNR